MATDLSPSLESLAQRVTNLEREFAMLRQPDAKNGSQDWVSRLMGTFKDDDEFAEILRLGREYRAAQRDEAP